MRRPGDNGNRRLLGLLKIAVTVGLIVFVLYHAGLFSAEGREAFADVLTGVDPVYLSVSLVLGVLLNLVSAWKWRILLASRQYDVGLWRLFALYYVGKFFNLFLPTGMGGDVARVYELGKITGVNSDSLASVFLERFTGMITLTAVSAIAVFVSFREYDLPIITLSLLFCALAASVVIWLILDQRPLLIITRWVSGHLPGLQSLFTKMLRVHDAIRAYKDDLPTLVVSFAISLLFYFLAVLNVWVSALAFSSDVAFLTILVAVPAIMLIMNLPVSIGGIGLMEAAYTIILTAFGYSSALALSTALLMRLKTLVDGLVGGLLYLARGGRTEPPGRTRDED